MSPCGPTRTFRNVGISVASLIGRLGSSTFRLSAASVSMPLAGSCFSSESAPRPFHHGIRGRGGTILSATLLSSGRQVQSDIRTHLIHCPARDTIPPLGGVRVTSYGVLPLLGLLARLPRNVRVRQVPKPTSHRFIPWTTMTS